MTRFLPPYSSVIKWWLTADNKLLEQAFFDSLLVAQGCATHFGSCKPLKKKETETALSASWVEKAHDKDFFNILSTTSQHPVPFILRVP